MPAHRDLNEARLSGCVQQLHPNRLIFEAHRQRNRRVMPALLTKTQ
jgi:hypothetical protein